MKAPSHDMGLPRRFSSSKTSDMIHSVDITEGSAMPPEPYLSSETREEKSHNGNPPSQDVVKENVSNVKGSMGSAAKIPFPADSAADTSGLDGASTTVENGTPLGDRITAEAVGSAFQERAEKNRLREQLRKQFPCENRKSRPF